MSHNKLEGKYGAAFMRGLLKTFCKDIRGRAKKEFNHPFWDLIVITTMDEDQKQGYEIQLSDKIRNKELPIDVPFHVICDQPDYKIGNGGSTMHSIYVLHKMYGEDLYSKRTLIIHAGGMSQRLPCVSVPGKVFLAFPIGDPIFQALELLICMYMPFIHKMNPGFLVCCSDMLITYDLDLNNSDWSFMAPGFTALGHASPLHMGEKHGVYVLDEAPSKDQLKSSVFTANCVKVLQKPSIQKLYENNAVITNDSGIETVYTDSCFFFDVKTAKTLAKFYGSHKPLTCEIDAYGDFLPSLGINATGEHIKNFDNVVKATPELLDMRKNVFQLLHGSKISLIIMNCSRFYHVGTLIELIQNFCVHRDLIENLGLGRLVSSKIIGEGPIRQIGGVVMHSVVHKESVIPYNSIVTYSRINTPVIIGEHTIISNCSIKETLNTGKAVVLPDNVMFHTIPLQIDGSSSFVTVAFDIDDDVKVAFPLSKIHHLKYLGISMNRVLKILNIETDTAFDYDNPCDCSLWKAKIFAKKPTMEESFVHTLKRVMCLKRNKPLIALKIQNLYSMADILHYKDPALLLAYRTDLKNYICK